MDYLQFRRNTWREPPTEYSPNGQKLEWGDDSDPFGVFSALADSGIDPPRVMEAAEARHEANKRSESILTNYRLLSDIMRRHESKVQRRWGTRTRTQRSRILLDCWPGMPPTHRPDIAIVRKYGDRLSRILPEERCAFIWPYINQDDLMRTKSLPLLLNSRGRYHPTEFAAADSDAMRVGIVAMAISPVLVYGHIIILNGTTRDEDYGRLMALGKQDVLEQLKTRRQYSPGEGLLVLEAQDRLLEFLVACCQVILHDIPRSELLSDDHPIEPELPRNVTMDSNTSACLAIITEEAPYRPPSSLDLDYIQSLLSARLAQAEDHIWSLREDPGYFSERLFEIREHRSEFLKDLQGFLHPTVTSARQDLLWSCIVNYVLLDAYLPLEMFSQLQSEVSEVRDLRQKHLAEISPMKKLPEE